MHATKLHFNQDCLVCGRKMLVRVERLGKEIAYAHCNAVTVARDDADRRYWHSELDMWAADVANWKSEQADALAELKQVEAEIAEHGKALDAPVTYNTRVMGTFPEATPTESPVREVVARND